VLFLVATIMFKVCPLKPRARSSIWLGILALAALLPLMVLVPSPTPTPAMPFTSAVIPAPALENALFVKPAAQLAHAAWDTEPSNQPAQLQHVVLLVWLLGSIWHLRSLWRGWRAARGLRRSAMDTDRLQSLMREEFADNYTVKVCDGIATPMAVGLVHPCILVPRAIAAHLPHANLVDVLNHEIAHIRRGDVWTSVAQRLFTAIYWWSPVFRVIGARLDMAREMACDEQATRRSGEPNAYAKSLLACIDLVSAPKQRDLLNSPMFGSQKALTQRINELLRIDMEGRRSRRVMSSIVWGTSMAAVVTATFAATPRVGSTSGNDVPSATAAWSAQVAAASRNSLKVEVARRLLEATHANRADTVRALLGHGADIDAGVDGEGTALIVAAKDGNLHMVDALLEMGARVDAIWPGDGTPLIAAIKCGEFEIVKRLLAAGANPNAISAYDETPLINATREGRLDIVRYLVEHGAKLSLGVWADGGRWRTPLNQARRSDVRAYLLGKGAT
jgi:beta-lactamase regulating signal transducer with metallopeptidase domain